jgi:hypothetical protein
LLVTYVATTSPPASAIWIVVPASAVLSSVAESQPCAEPLSGVTTIPALKAELAERGIAVRETSVRPTAEEVAAWLG